MKNNYIKNNPLNPNSNPMLDLDKRILPIFSVPVILKRISEAKKDKNYNPLNPPKKLMSKFIKLNEKLVKLTTSIKKYDLNLDSLFINKKKLPLNTEGQLSAPQPGTGLATTADKVALLQWWLQQSEHLRSANSAAATAAVAEGAELVRSTANSNQNLNMNAINKTEFILFTRIAGQLPGNSHYKLKFSLSNILYILERFRPVLKLNSLLKNIYLFAPKSLFKPQPYITYKYRIIEINDKFKNKYSISERARLALQLLEGPEAETPSAAMAAPHKGQPLRPEGAAGQAYVRKPVLLNRTNRSKVLIRVYNYNIKKKKKKKSSLPITNENNAPQSNIQLYKFESGISIKYILLELNNILNEIENLINIKNTLIAAIRKKKIENLVNFIKLSIIIEKNESDNTKKGHLPSSNFSALIALGLRRSSCSSLRTALVMPGCGSAARGLDSSLLLPLRSQSKTAAQDLTLRSDRSRTARLSVALPSSTKAAVAHKGNRASATQLSKSAKLVTKKIPFLAEWPTQGSSGMVKDNIIKIEKSMNLILPTLPASQGKKKIKIEVSAILPGSGSAARLGSAAQPKPVLGKNTLAPLRKGRTSSPATPAIAGAQGGGLPTLALAQAVKDRGAKISTSTSTTTSLAPQKGCNAGAPVLRKDLQHGIKHTDCGASLAVKIGPVSNTNPLPLRLIRSSARATTQHHSLSSKKNQQRLKGIALRGEQRLLLIRKNITKFEAKKDILNENSNPVRLLYFNDNLKKPIINQYLKSMSTYNMITNGAILYYSNIIGFNFKNKIRAYLPFFKPVSVSINSSRKSSLAKDLLLRSLRTNQLGAGGSISAFATAQPARLQVESSKGNDRLLINSVRSLRSPARQRGAERLTSPYPLRAISKVAGFLDKGKFSIFGRGIENNKLINNIYKFLYLSFKSMYCLISKPVFITKSNKIIIQLFYFLLIPKIFKHMKSKSDNKPTNKKEIYWKNLVKKKKLALATLYQSRLKKKEEAMKEKYFVTLMQGVNTKTLQSVLPALASAQGQIAPTLSVGCGARAQPGSSSAQGRLQVLNNNQFVAEQAKLIYKNELLKIREIEESISGVKFDKFGLVTFKSLESKIKKLGVFYTMAERASLSVKFLARIQRDQKKVYAKDTRSLTGPALLLRTKAQSAVAWPAAAPHAVKVKKGFYKMLFKRFEFNNINNDLQFFTILIQKEKGRVKESKLFKVLAKTYLNIFKFKVSHPIFNKLKLRWLKKELVKDKSDLLYSIIKRRATGLAPTRLLPGHTASPQYPAPQQVAERKKLNSYNINWFLFSKLFWNMRLSKKIIPNPKILHKLGIPQWRWPYSKFKKKGYALSDILRPGQGITNTMRSSATKQHYEELLRMGSNTVNAVLQEAATQPFVSYTWPFSLLMLPTILQINKKINNATAEHANAKLNTLCASDTQDWTLLRSQETTLGLDQQRYAEAPRPASTDQSNLQIKPVLQKRNRYIIGELYTKRNQLMKLANINLIKIYPLKFEKLCEVLNSIFNKPVELDLIRLHYPYNDSNILVRLIAFMINKVQLRRITRRLFNKAVIKSIKKINNKDKVNIIPAFLSGMTIKVAGRLMKYRVVPRKTVKLIQRGSSSIGKINYSDVSRYTNKNKRGSFSITIKSGQNFIN